MRNETIQAVTKAVKDGKPRTIPEIMNRTSLSYNTVRVALPKTGATAVPDTWPIAYQLPVDAVVSKEAIGEGDRYVTVAVLDKEDWPDKWNKSRKKFGTEAASLEIAKDSDPEELAKSFANGARTLASLAELLSKHHDKPDWFTLIGGEVEK